MFSGFSKILQLNLGIGSWKSSRCLVAVLPSHVIGTTATAKKCDDDSGYIVRASGILVNQVRSETTVPRDFIKLLALWKL